MYIQDKVAEYSDEIFTRMDNVRRRASIPHTYPTAGCTTTDRASAGPLRA